MASVENRLIGAVKRLYTAIYDWENDMDDDPVKFNELRVRDQEVRELLRELNRDVTAK